MEGEDYFRSITLELQALKNRVGHFLHGRHWLTEGEWKESVLRTVIRRHLPQTIGIGRGFVVTDKGPSTQIDILLYDLTKPLLYHDGDLVIVTPDLCAGIIEVKTRVTLTQLREAIQKLAECRYHISRSAQCRPFTGLFVYEHEGDDVQPLLNDLKIAANQNHRRIIDCASLGQSLFARYWHCPPPKRNTPTDIFRAYKLPQIAPAFFVHNVIESLCEESVLRNNQIWYSGQDIEQCILREIALRDPLPPNASDAPQIRSAAQ